MIRTRGKQRRAHAKGHRASIEAFRRILEQKFIENDEAIATAMIEAAKKANTAAVRETVKQVEAIDEPEDKQDSEQALKQILIWQNEPPYEPPTKENTEPEQLQDPED